MRLFFMYIRQRRRVVAAFAVFCCVFAAVFVLYRLPLGAVIYPALLCGLIGCGIFALDFLRVKRRHRTLESIRGVCDAAVTALPSADGVEDTDYQQIISLMLSDYAGLRGGTERRYSDMINYYTVWAHQIKTPIASMRLRLQNEDSRLSRQLSSDLFRIEQYAEMVLAFLRLDSESTDYVIRECDLDGIVRQAVRRFSGEFILRRLRLVYRPLKATVVTDEKWLVFVVEQLLSNALKYGDKKLKIIDTGIGISPEDLPRVFENGYTGCNGRTDKRATGIGLYLCKRVCGNLGHGITIKSQVGCGTEVTVDLAQKRPGTE